MFGLTTYSGLLLALLAGTWRRPAVGIAAVLCLYGLKQWGQSATALLSVYRQFTNFAVFAICLLGLLRAAQRRGCVICGIQTTSVLVFAIFMYAFLTISWAPDPGTSLDQWIITGPYILTITVLAPLLVRDLDDSRAAFVATALAGGALCILALAFGHWGDRGLVVFGHEALEDAINIYRYETNPLALSTLAGTVFIICALSVGRPNRAPMRLFALACIPVALIVILKSGSRGQLLASGAGILVALPLAFRPRDGKSFATLVVTGAVVLALAWWGASFVNLGSGRWTDTQASQDVEGRLAMAQALLGASTSSGFTTLFGLGNSSAFQVVGIYPHITGLEVLAEEGLFGAGLYFAILIRALRSVRRLTALDLTDAQRNTLAILAGLFVFELILSWKQGSLLFSVYVFAYAIVLARAENLLLARSPKVEAAAVGMSAPRFHNLLR